MLNACIEEENPSLNDVYEAEKSNGLRLKDLENMLKLPKKTIFIKIY